MQFSIQRLGNLALFWVLLLTLGSCTQANANDTGSTPGKKLIVYVPGLNASLPAQQAAQNNGYGYDASFFDQGGIASYFKSKDSFKDAQTMVFSYRGFSADGKPGQDYCQDTYNNTLRYDASLLNLQITAYLQKHQGTQVYIIAHSLGGVVAFAYLAQQVEVAHSVTLVNGGILKGVAILDSPLGGVTGGSAYYSFAIKALGTKCDPQLVNYAGIRDLQRLYDTTINTTHKGSDASILQIVSGQSIANGQVLYDATKLGVNILVVGNEYDIMWQPDVCDETMPNFLPTQYVLSIIDPQAKGVANILSFQSGEESCKALLNNANHLDVLANGDVQKAILETFLGKHADVLTLIDNLHMPAGIPTPTPTPSPTPMPTPVVSGTYNGSLTNTTLNQPAGMHVRFASVSANGSCSGYFTVDPPLYGSGNFTGTISGNSITFTVTPDDSTLAPMVFNGTLSADDSSMSGTYTVTGRGQQGTWSVSH